VYRSVCPVIDFPSRSESRSKRRKSAQVHEIAATIGAVAALAVIPTTAAFADQGAAIVGAQAYYTTGNDQLSAQDTQSDGKSAIAEIRSGSGGSVYSVTASGGSGTVEYRTVSMPASYQIRACVQDIGGGGAKTCGSWINGS